MIIEKIKRKLYVIAMFRAIRIARNSAIFSSKSSKTDALQCIKDFERVNKIKFNPWCRLHCDQIAGMANFAGFHRAVKRIK